MPKKMYPQKPILIVDDEEHALNSFEMTLKTARINNVITCSESRNVMGILKGIEVELILLDLMMPYKTGEELLEEIKKEYPHVPVIMVTAVNEIDKAISCIKQDAFDYITKPVKPDRMINSVNKALELQSRTREVQVLRESIFSGWLQQPEAFKDIITQNKTMLAVFQYCQAVASTPSPVLITGEEGAGKSLLAKAMHDLSANPGNFVVYDSAKSEVRPADEIFGHVKDAYFGAVNEAGGAIEQAGGGTLYIKEVANLDDEAQGKLLQLLQEQQYSPLGAAFKKYADVKIIVSTHRSLKEVILAGKFRKDLYYQLMTHHINVPPLRFRINDIPPLLEYFLSHFANKYEKKKPTYHPSLITLLQSYTFPRNIWELMDMVDEAMKTHEAMMLSNKTFQERIGNPTDFLAKSNDRKDEMSPETACTDWKVLPTIKDMGQLLIKEAMKRAGGNQTVAANLLGISKQALNQRLKKA